MRGFSCSYFGMLKTLMVASMMIGIRDTANVFTPCDVREMVSTVHHTSQYSGDNFIIIWNIHRTHACKVGDLFRLN